jgi:hypothetical protein
MRRKAFERKIGGADKNVKEIVVGNGWREAMSSDRIDWA